MDILNFYKTLFGKCSDCKLGITTINKDGVIAFKYFSRDEIPEMVRYVEAVGKDKHTYFNVCPRRAVLNPDERGTAADVSYIVSLWSDFDVKGPAHKEDTLPPSKEAVLEFLPTSLPVPTYLVDTGYGIDAFWVFEKPFRIDSDASFEQAKAIVSGYGKHIADVFLNKGWKTDNVFDLPRMLRAPGSMNHKFSMPVECRIIAENDVFYNIEDFEKYREEAAKFEHTSFTADERTVGSAERIMEKCVFAQKLVNDANAVTEPEWKALCSNIVLAADGIDKFHSWSSLYNDYSYDETERKIKYSLSSKTPCTCKYIHEHLGFDCPVGGCGVKAPIVLAQYTKEEQIANMLDNNNLKAEDMLEDYELGLAAYAKEHLPIEYGRIKLKAKSLKLSAKDFENAVKSKMRKKAMEDFSAEPSVICIDGLSTNGAKEPQGFNVTGSGVHSIHYEDNIPVLVQTCDSPIAVTRRLENIDTGQEQLELSFLRNGRAKTVIAPRSVILNKSNLTRLADNGLPVNSANADALVRYISAYEAENDAVIPFTRSITRIGWIGNEFYPYCTSSEVVYENTDGENIVGAIREAGAYDTWLKTAQDVRKNPFARAMLNMSFASPLLEKLQHRIIILHIWHSSRSGKTAALKFALSVWGDPLILMGSYNSTAVGMERRAGILKHLPLGLDELQVLNDCKLSPSKIVYSLGNGYGKTRGAKNGGIQDTYTWRNTVISTGEQPLSSETSMDGVTSRVLELYGAPIDNFEQGRNVHRISESNYGFAGKEYIRYLIKNVLCEKSKIVCDYEHIRDALSSSFNGDLGVHFDNIAALALADYYASKAVFGLDEDTAIIEAIAFGKIILENAKSLEKEDITERAWHFVIDWVASNKSRFDSSISPCYGKIENGKVYIIVSVLRQALTENGFNYTKSIKGFKENGHIETFSNSEGNENAQCQKKIQGVNARVICALMDASAITPFDEDDNDFPK